MYSFSLGNKFNKVFAVIEYSEEKSLNALYEKDIPFIKNYGRNTMMIILFP